MERSKIPKHPVCVKCSQTFSINVRGTNTSFGARSPLLLRCGHSACETCIKNALKVQSGITCSACQNVSSVSSLNFMDTFRSDFPINIYLLGQISLRNILNQPQNPNFVFTKTKKVLAEAKNDPCIECCVAAAEMFCRQCKVPYCPSCFDKVHSSAKAFKTHEKGLLIEMMINSDMVSAFCETHSEQKLEFFCKQCTQTTCSHCVICKHLGHDIISLREKNEESRNEFKEAYAQATEVYRRLQFTKKKVSRGAAALPGPRDATADEDLLLAERAVTKHFTFMYGLLQIRETQLLDRLASIRTSPASTLHDVEQEIDETIKKVKDTLEIGKYLLEPNQMSQVNLDKVRAQINEVVDVPCHLVYDSPESDIKIRFEPDETLITAELLSKIDVVVPTGGVYTLRATKDLPIDYEVEEIPQDLGSEKKRVTPLGISVSSVPASGRTSRSSSLKQEVDDTSPVLPSPVPISVPSDSLEKLDLAPGTSEMVSMCHIISPSDFYVHRSGSLQILNGLKQQFAMLNKYSMQCSKNEVVTGGLYLLQHGSDKQWYRVRAFNLISDTKVEVFYIDFGNRESVSVTKLFKMPPRFISAGRAVHCCLYMCEPITGEWTLEATNMMMDMTTKNGPELLMIIMDNLQKGMLLSVDLCLMTGTVPPSIRSALIFMEVAQSDGNLDTFVRRSAPNPETIPTDEILPGVILEVVVSHVISPTDFYIRKLGEDHKYLTKMMAEMNILFSPQNQRRFNSNSSLIYAPELDMCVAAQYTEDGQWYRAVVVGLPGKRGVRVRYTDFGNTETLPWDKLRVLPERFLRLSAQAVRCSLCDVAPPQGTTWPQTTKAAFIEMSNKKQLRLAVESVSETHYKVVLYLSKPDVDICLNALLVQKQLANTTGVNSTVVEYPKMRKITTSDDNCVDNQSVVSESVYSQQQNKNAKPIKRSHHNSVGRSQKGGTSQKSDSSQMRMLGALQKGGSSVEDSVADTETTIDLADDDLFRIEVKVLSVHTPCHFYVSLMTQLEQIETLKREMTDYYEEMGVRVVSSNEQQWKEGDKCAVYNSADKTWYRASIIQLLPLSNAKVFLKDIALLETVKNCHMQVLDDTFKRVRDGAVRCHLSGIMAPGDNGQWPGLACEMFQDEIEKYDKIYITNKGDIENNSLPVEMWVKQIITGGALDPILEQWRSINQFLVNQGLALPNRSDMDRKDVPSLEVLRDLEHRLPEETMDKSITDWLLKSQVCTNFMPPEPEMVELPIAPRKQCIPIAEQVTSWKDPEPFSSLSFQAMPTYVDTECCLYIQEISKSADSLIILRKAMESRFADSTMMPQDMYWFPGQICIAQYHDDKNWYRAKVLDVNNDNTLEVQFVDYGNIERCKTSELRKNIYMSHIPVQCHKVIYNLAKPTSDDGGWPTKVLDFIHELIVEKLCFITVKLNSNNQYEVVSLRCPGNHELADLLVSMLYAEHCTPSMPTAAKQREEEMEDEDNMDDDDVIVELDESQCLPLPKATPRPSLQQSTPKQPSLQPAPKPPMLQPSCLPPLIDPTPPPSTTDVFSPSSMLFPSAKQPEFSWADIVVMDEEAANFCDFSYNRLILPDCNELSVEVTSILSTTDFTIQVYQSHDMVLSDIKKEYKELMETMQREAPNQLPLTKPFIGQPCCACFTDDNKWYRSIVIKETDMGQLQIQYVDFGNVETLPPENVFQLKPEWASVPVQGLICSLWGVSKPKKFKPEATLCKLVDCIFQAPLTAVIKSRSPLLVELYKDGTTELAYQNLIDDGLLTLDDNSISHDY